MCSAPTSAWCLRSRRLLAAACILLAAAVSAAAQDIAFSIRIAGPTSPVVGTRQTLTASLAVTNGPLEHTLVVETVLPAGWRVVAGGDAFTLAPGREDLRLLSVLVPSSAPAGHYLLKITVRETREGGASATVELPVTVRDEPALSLYLLERPPFVVAGAPCTALFMLVNTGNVIVHPVLSAHENLGLAVELPDLPQRLEPGGQLEVPVTVRTDAHIRGPVVHRLTLSVRDEPGAVDEVDAALAKPLAQASYSVEIVPLSEAGGVPMHSLRLDSLTIGRSGYSGDLDASLKEFLSLTGSLDEAGEHRIEANVVKLLATGADPLVTLEDRYSVAWRHRLGSVTLGDAQFTLSPLLAANENGRGVQASFTPRGIHIGAMYFSDPLFGTAEDWLGALVGARFPLDRTEDQAFYSVDAAVRWPLADAVAFGLSQRLRPIKGVDMQLDAALHADGAGGFAPAILAEANAEFDGISGNLRFLRAWPDFDVEYHDSQSLSASATSILLDGNLSLTGSFSIEDSNLLRDPGLPNASRSVAGSLHASGTVPSWGSRPMLFVRLMSERDLLPTPDFDLFDALVHLGWVQKLEGVDLSMVSTLDQSVDRLNDHWSTTLTDEVTAAWPLSPALGMSTSLQYNGRLRDVGLSWHTIGWKIGARGTWPMTSLEGSTSTSWTFSDAGLHSIMVGLSASGRHVFPRGHSIQADADVSVTRDILAWSPAFSLSLSYRTCTDVPLYRTHDSSVVRGRVFLEETGAPREGVLLRLNGLAAITDASGKYVFNIPKSGTYQLQVDRGTLGKGMIPSRATPIELNTLPRTETVIDIGVIESATLSGTVSVWGYHEGGAFEAGGGSGSESAELSNLGGLGNVVLELRNGSDPIRRLSNPSGRFEFAEVRPGHYTLAVIGGLIPTYHHVEQNTYTVELEPGQEGLIEIRVVQERRRIQMVDAGTIEVAEIPSRGSGEFSVPEKIQAPAVIVAPPDTSAPAPVEQPPAPVEPQPAPVEPATVEQPPAPVQPQRVPGERHVAPDQPPHETQVMAAQAGFNAPALTWQQVLAAMQTQPIPPSGPSATAAAVPPAAPQTPAAATPAPATTAPVTAAPAAAAPKPPSTAPVTTAPAAPAPAPSPNVPAPTPPPIRIPIPLPMPTPKPPVTVPVPTPTPQPFWP
jgi:hypothetical protein